MKKAPGFRSAEEVTAVLTRKEEKVGLFVIDKENKKTPNSVVSFSCMELDAMRGILRFLIISYKDITRNVHHSSVSTCLGRSRVFDYPLKHFHVGTQIDSYTRDDLVKRVKAHCEFNLSKDFGEGFIDETLFRYVEAFQHTFAEDDAAVISINGNYVFEYGYIDNYLKKYGKLSNNRNYQLFEVRLRDRFSEPKTLKEVFTEINNFSKNLKLRPRSIDILRGTVIPYVLAEHKLVEERNKK